MASLFKKVLRRIIELLPSEIVIEEIIRRGERGEILADTEDSGDGDKVKVVFTIPETIAGDA